MGPFIARTEINCISLFVFIKKRKRKIYTKPRFQFLFRSKVGFLYIKTNQK